MAQFLLKEIKLHQLHKVEVITCKICNKPFYRKKRSNIGTYTPIRVRKTGTVTCSRKCSNTYTMTKYRGVKNES